MGNGGDCKQKLSSLKTVTGGRPTRRPTRADGNEGFDRLTGLPNRHLFRDRVQQALYHSRRAEKAVAVLTIAPDHDSTYGKK